MKTLEFNLAGNSLRVYLTAEMNVYLDAADIALAVFPGMDIKEFEREFSNFITGEELPRVYSEEEFFRMIRRMEAEGGIDDFLSYYLWNAVPMIRRQIAILSEKSWSESDKVRQLEQDLEMNLAARRKAEEKLIKYPEEYKFILKQLTLTSADNGVMSRLLLEIMENTKDEKQAAKIAEVLKNNAIPIFNAEGKQA